MNTENLPRASAWLINVDYGELVSIVEEKQEERITMH